MTGEAPALAHNQDRRGFDSRLRFMQEKNMNANISLKMKQDMNVNIFLEESVSSQECTIDFFKEEGYRPFFRFSLPISFKQIINEAKDIPLAATPAVRIVNWLCHYHNIDYNDIDCISMERSGGSDLLNVFATLKTLALPKYYEYSNTVLVIPIPAIAQIDFDNQISADLWDNSTMAGPSSRIGFSNKVLPPKRIKTKKYKLVGKTKRKILLSETGSVPKKRVDRKKDLDSCSECGIYNRDWPSARCQGCNEYLDHTAV